MKSIRQHWTPHLVLHLAGVLNLSQINITCITPPPILKQAIMQVIVKRKGRTVNGQRQIRILGDLLPKN